MTNHWKRVLIALTIAALATCFADSAVAARRHHHAHHHGGAVRYSYAPRVYAPHPHVSGYGVRGPVYGGYAYPSYHHHHHHHHHGW